MEAYFDEISQDTGKFCYGIDDTLKALDLGAVEKLIVFENLETIRYTFKDAEDNEVIKLAEPEAKDKSFAIDKATGQEMGRYLEEPLIEWLAANYKNFGASWNSSQTNLQKVPNLSQVLVVLVPCCVTKLILNN